MKHTRLRLAALVVVGILASAMASSAGTPASANVDNNDQLGAQYRFDTADGTNFSPETPSALPETTPAPAFATGTLGMQLNGAASISPSSGQNGQGTLSLNGTTDYASAIKKGGSADTSTNMTLTYDQFAAVAVTFKSTLPGGFTGNRSLVSRAQVVSGTYQGTWDVGITPTGAAYCSLSWGGGATVQTVTTGTTTLTDGNWHTVICAHNLFGGNEGLWVFADGKIGDGTNANGWTATTNTYVATSATNSSPLMVGDSIGGGGFFKGLIDAVSFSNPLGSSDATLAALVQAAGPNAVPVELTYWNSCAVNAASFCATNPLQYQFALDSTQHGTVAGVTGTWFGESTTGTAHTGGLASGAMGLREDIGTATDNPAAPPVGLTYPNGVNSNTTGVDLPNSLKDNAGGSCTPTDNTTTPPLPCVNGSNEKGANVLQMRKINNTAFSATSPTTTSPVIGGSAAETAVLGVVWKTNITYGADALQDTPNIVQQGNAASTSQMKIQVGDEKTAPYRPVTDFGDRWAECRIQGTNSFGLAYGGDPILGNGVNIVDGSWHSILCIKNPDTVSHGSITMIVDGNPWTTQTASPLGDVNIETDVSTGFGAGGYQYLPTLCGREGNAAGTNIPTNQDSCNGQYDGLVFSRSTYTSQPIQPSSPGYLTNSPAILYWEAMLLAP
jgi:hypothetical protein